MEQMVLHGSTVENRRILDCHERTNLQSKRDPKSHRLWECREIFAGQRRTLVTTCKRARILVKIVHDGGWTFFYCPSGLLLRTKAPREDVPD